MVQAEGVQFKTGANVGENVSAAELMEGNDVVLLCCGAKQARDINAPGRDASGIYFAVDYLTSVTQQPAGLQLCRRQGHRRQGQEGPGHRRRRHRQ